MAPPLTPKRVAVPGLLSDDGLAQGVAALKGQLGQNAANGNATTGVDIGQRIIDVDVQMPSPRAPTAAPTSQPSSTIQLSGSPAPIETAAPPTPGFGMLTPEQSAAEQQQRVEQADASVAAIKSDNELGEQLRNMTDEQASEFDIPRDPFATPAEAQATRDRLAQQEADYLQQETKRADFVREAPPPNMSWWMNAMQVGARAAAQTGTSALKYPFSAFEAATYTATGIDVGKTAPRAWIDIVDKQLETILPGDPSRAKDFVTELSAGAGSFIPFVLAGYIGAAAGLPAAVTAGGLGAAATGNQLYEEAEDFNAPMAQKALALIMGTGLGATEAIPIDRMFMRADVGTGGLLRRMLANTQASTLEEFTQEFGQAIGEDMVAKYGAGYDPDRQLDAMSWLRSGLIGGIVGGVAGGATTLVPAAGPRAEDTAATVEEVFNREQARFNAVVGSDAAQEGVDALDPGSTEAVAAPGQQPGEATQGPAVESEPTPVIPTNEPVAVPKLDGVQRIVDAVAVQRAARSRAPAAAVETATATADTTTQTSAIQSTSVAPTRPPIEIVETSRVSDERHSEIEAVLESEVRSQTALTPEEQKIVDDGYAQANGGAEVYPLIERGLVPAPRDIVVYRGFNSDAQPDASEFLSYGLSRNVARTFAGFDDAKISRVVIPAGTPIYSPRSGISGGEVLFRTADLAETTVATPDVNNQVAAGLPTRSTIDAVQLGTVDTTPLPNIEKGLTGPIPMVVKAARAYAQAVGLPHRRQRDYVRVDAGRAARIAQAYTDMQHQPNDPAVQASYRAMADETIAQYQFVKATGLKIETIQPGQPDPYPNGPRDVLKDIQAGHIWYFPTDQGFGSSEFDPTGNPLLDETGEVSDNGSPMVVNDLFRVVHDFFGHGMEGSGFGARGEENAWQAHMRLYSANAVPAMTSETRGQNSWVNYGPFGEQNRADPRNTVYADQKTGIMPSWTWSEGVADSASTIWAAPVETKDPTAFREALIAAKTNSKYGGAVNVYDDYSKMRTFLSDDGLAGFALNGEDIVSVFSRGGGRLKSIIDTAIANGGRTLDAFDTGTAERPGLVQMYGALGFVETERLPFDPKQAPAEWPAELGKPDVVFMSLATEEVVERMEAKTLASPEFQKWFKGSKVVDADGAPLVVYHGTDAPDFEVFRPGAYFTADNTEASAYTFNSDVRRREKAAGKYAVGSGADVIGQTIPYAGTLSDFEDIEAGDVVATDQAGIARYLGKGNWQVFNDVEPDSDTFNAAEMTIAVKAGQFDAQGISDEYEAFVRETYPGGDRGRVYPVYLSIKNPVVLGPLEGNRLGRRLGATDASIEAEIAKYKAQGYDGIETISDEASVLEGNTIKQFIPFDATQVKSTANRGTFSADDPNILRMATGTSSTRQPFALEPTRPARGVPDQPTNPPQEGDDVKLTQIGANLRKLLNLTVRHGRLTGGKNVMGEYNKKTGAIRMRTWTDLSTLVHEAGHALNDSMAGPLDAFVQRNSAEIMRLGVQIYAGDLSNANAQTRQREGFAEFFRVYTMTPDYARNKWGTLTTDFENTLRNADPKVLDGLNAIAEQFKAWLQLPSAKLIRNMVVDGRREQGINAAIKELKDMGFKSWFEEYTRRAVDHSVNRFAPLNTLVNELLNQSERNNGAVLDLKRAEDPRTLVRLARNAGSRAMVEVTDGVYGYRSLQPISRGLRDAIMLSQGVDPSTTPGALDENRLTDFSAYLVALRAQDEYRRLDEGRIDRPPIAASKGDVQRAIKDYEAQYGKSFTDAAAIAHEYGMALWQKQYDAGLMSKETYLDGLERQFYVPLQRDMSDKKENFGPSAMTAGQRSLVRQFKGSDRDIVDPMAILMQKTFALEQLINENEVIKSLAILADRAGRAGALVERIPATQVMGMTMSVEEAARQLSKDDSLSPADAQDLMTILGASIQNGATIQLFQRDQVSTKGENILFFWENGKPAAIQLKDGSLGVDVVNVLQGVGRENMPMFTELVAATSSAFRTAITSWPDFLVVNYIRDQMSAWILSDVGFIPFVSGIRGMADEVRQKTWAKSYNAAQGIMGGMNVAALHEAKVDQDIRSLRSKGYLAQAFSDKTPFLGAIRGMARVTALSETGTRLGIFRGAVERARKDGLNEYEASIEGAYTATDYIDFGLNGSRMTLARRTIPFLNAQLQGLYKMLRTLGGDEVQQRKGLKFALGAYFKNSKNLPLSRVEQQAVNTGRAAWVKMASLGMISALLHLIFRDDPDYQEAGEYLRVTGWVIPMGDGRVFYVPKPFELALMANAVERGLEFASGDKEAPGRFLRGAAMALTPPTAPTSIQLAIELSANKDFFTGRDIVPTYQQALEPQLQYNNYTSSIAKWMGSTFGWSPLVVDHVLSGLGASAFRDIAAVTNAADPTRPSIDETDAPLLRRFIRDVRKGSVSAQDFWAQASQTTGRLERTYQTYKRFVEYGNDVAANGYLASLTADEKAYALLMTHFEPEQKRLNPFYRARQVSTLVSGMRREIASELGLADTTVKDIEQSYDMTARQKQQVDEVLSEIARREVRNTLIATGQGGWTGKDILPLDGTLDLLATVSPDTYDEYMRRYRKNKIYDAQAVYDYWPEVRDRLNGDGEFAVLGDVQAIAGVVF